MEDQNNILNNATLKDGFAGDRRYLKGFLAKIELVFMLYPDRYNTDEAKVIYLISRLYGDAMNWAATLIENRDDCLGDYQAFRERMKAVFGDNDSVFIANQKLRVIKQRRLGDITSYINEFNKYSDNSSWNEDAKMDAFIAGLQDSIATILEMFPGPRNLLSLQTIAARIDSRISTHRQFFNHNKHSNDNKTCPKFTPKKKSSNNNNKSFSKLSNEERERRIREHLCLYCADPDHIRENCPKLKKNKPSSSSHISNPVLNSTLRPRISDQPNHRLPIFDFTLSISDVSVNSKILLDSGSQLNLMDVYYAKENNIPYNENSKLPSVSGIGGDQLILGKTLPISLKYGNHICQAEFYIVDLPSYCAILGTDWLFTHNPTINFVTKELSFKSSNCISNCLLTPNSFTAHISSPTTVPSTKEKEPATVDRILKLLPTILQPYKDIFDEGSANILPPHRQYDCEIKLKPNSILYYGPIYPLTDAESKALKEYIEENLSKGFIRKSKSPAGAPVFFVFKKNGELRMVVDYRKLNEITIRDSYPLPLINDMLEHLGKGKVFSKLDLRSAYNLVRIKEGDEYKTAFTCKYGHFEYLVMPFGLKNAPAVFQHFINDVFEDILGTYVYCYIDDIIIFSPDMSSHFEHVIEVLKRLRKAGLFAKLEKCEFFVPYLDFLGHRISATGIFMDPKKISSILEWPTPTCVKEIQSFLGLTNYYRRFIPGFAKLAHPLNHLLRKNVKFVWSIEAQEAFDNIKSKFSSSPVLAYPDRNLPFTVETDSSNFAIGAVLSQKTPKDNKVHPIAFYSRSLSPVERNYPIYDKELLAIIDSLENWRHFLKGATHPFIIYSDHRNLLYQKKPEKMTQRLVRWSLFLSEFNFKIEYRSGSSNGKPDALSRRPDYALNYEISTSDIPFTVLRPENFSAFPVSVETFSEKILSECKTDPFYHSICDYLENKKLPVPHQKIKEFSISNSYLLFQNKLYVPPNCRSLALKICHDSPSAGHFGFKKTINLLNRDFWWPSLNSDAQDYIRSCETCCRSKVLRHKPYGFLQPLEIPSRPWSSVSMDFITDLPLSNGFTCIFVTVDRFSKMSHFIPFANIPSAIDTASAFMKSIFRLHGLPDEILSDRGSQFTSKFWIAICKALGINMKYSSPFHHQTNGLTERVNSVVEQYLRCFTNFKGSDWENYLYLAEFSYNNALQESSNYSPFFANYGYNPRHSPEIPSIINVPRAEELVKNLTDLSKELKKNLESASKKQEEYANRHRIKPPEFKANDKVWLNSSLVLRNKNKKLKPRKLGPFKIIQKVSPVTYKLDLPKKLRIHPIIHVSELEPYYEDTFGRNQPPPPVIVNNEEEYEVEKILDKRTYYGKIQYLIKWKGYPISESSWEPESNLNCPELLKDFNSRDK